MGKQFTKIEIELLLKYYEQYKNVENQMEQALLIKESLKKHNIDKSWQSISIKIRRLIGKYPVFNKDTNLETYYKLINKPLPIEIKKTKEELEKETISKAIQLIESWYPNKDLYNLADVVKIESIDRQPKNGLALFYVKGNPIKDYILVSRPTNCLHIFREGAIWESWTLSK